MTEVTSGIGNSAASRDKAYYLHPYTNLKTHEDVGPLVIERGEGVHVFDDSGKAYIEGMAGLWCTSLGFGEERLVEAATRQMRKLPFYHAFTHKAHDPGIDLAEALIKIAPVPMSKVFFTNSGSEANDTVVKLVWYYNNALGRPHKKKIIARQKGYHGVTVASASLTGLPHLHRDFDLPIAGILHTDCPHFYRYGEEGETEEDFATRLADQLEQLILAEGPDTIAAFIAEPVMGAGGVIVPPGDIFRQDPAGAEALRYPVHRRRGDLRVRAHGLDVRDPDLQPPARHHHGRQGALLSLSADRRRHDLRADLSGDGPPVGKDRDLRPWLHLFRPSGLPRRWRWKR